MNLSKTMTFLFAVSRLSTIANSLRTVNKECPYLAAGFLKDVSFHSSDAASRDSREGARILTNHKS
jgi:hypothetical protein